MKFRPEILTHPNIPKPLHGTNPRSILGQQWWDVKRKESYAKYDYHCWACGIHKSQAEFHQWLEGHEYYDIDYKKGTTKLIEIVALCYSCHNFIHSGRLYKLYMNDEINEDKITYILNHGFKILKKNKLKPFYGTAYVWLALQDYSEDEILNILEKKNLMPDDEKDFADWDKWKLIIDGKSYKGQFESYEDWLEFYG